MAKATSWASAANLVEVVVVSSLRRWPVLEPAVVALPRAPLGERRGAPPARLALEAGLVDSVLVAPWRNHSAGRAWEPAVAPEAGRAPVPADPAEGSRGPEAKRREVSRALLLQVAAALSSNPKALASAQPLPRSW